MKDATVDLLDAARTGEGQLLAKEIFDLYEHYWPEFSYEDFYAEHFTTPVVSQARIRRDPAGRVVGWGLGAGWDIEARGKPFRLLTGLVAVLPEYRGADRAFFGWGTLCVLREAALARLAGRTPVLIAICSSPVTFRSGMRYFPSSYPPFGRELEDEDLWRDVYRAALPVLHLPTDAGEGAIHTGVRQDYSDSELEHWRSHQDPLVRTFMEHCPGIGRGQELIVIHPIRFRDAPGIVARMFGDMIDSRMRKRKRRSAHPAKVAGAETVAVAARAPQEISGGPAAE